MFTALACCVFLWGMQYKLSLYDPPQATSHHVPVAKLLSKNEQSNILEKSSFTQSKPAIKALLAPVNLLLFILLVLSPISITASNFGAAVIQPPFRLQQALREAFFVRPPPIRTT